MKTNNLKTESNVTMIDPLERSKFWWLYFAFFFGGVAFMEWLLSKPSWTWWQHLIIVILCAWVACGAGAVDVDEGPSEHEPDQHP